jgi:hypothetical protein
VTECSKLISPLLSVRHSLSLQVTAILQHRSQARRHGRTAGTGTGRPLATGVMAEEERRAQAGGGDGGPSSGDAIPLSGVVGGAKGSPDAGGTGAADGGDAGGGEGQLRQRAGNSSGQKPSSSLRSKSYSETKSRSRDTRSGGGSSSSLLSPAGECRTENFEFRDRRLPPAEFQWFGASMYFIFLMLFSYHTLASRRHGYFFAEYAREVADLEHFMRIRNHADYQDWLESSFFPGMHWNSLGRARGGKPGIALVGAPRMRIGRARDAYTAPAPESASGNRGPLTNLWVNPEPPENCVHAEETAGLPFTCFDMGSEELGGGGVSPSLRHFEELAPWMLAEKQGGVVGSNSSSPTQQSAPSSPSPTAPTSGSKPLQLTYFTGEELEEEVYTSYTGQQYAAGGHLVEGISQLFFPPPTVQLSPTGSRSFPSQRLATDCSALYTAGLLHPATNVIFHDFTIYSATKDAYATVRLVLQVRIVEGT